MAYVSLYRKYRPQTFDEVVGQPHVTATLANAVDNDRLHHAYLFTGPRGTGKTSTARILAKAINCEQGPTSTPCNECDHCVAITEGSAVDVIELDMASHGGVDDARDLRERARLAPAGARRKVYILDEVHMASKAAFNALLKLIEEPPGHVVFAMATTDPQKVLPTIMSRVQRFDLRRVGAAMLAEHVRRVADAEGYAVEDAAVDAVVRAGDGSVRDTLSVLEQVLAFAGEKVTVDAVATVLGQTPFDRTARAVDAVAAGDLGGVMTLVQELQDDGFDLRRFAFDLLGHVRDLLVLQAAPDRPDLVEATEEQRGALAAQAGRLSQESLLHAVETLGTAVTEMRLGPPRLPLELALATLATPAVSPDLTAFADRLARLEQRVRDGATERPGAAAPSTTDSRSSVPGLEGATPDGAAPGGGSVDSGGASSASGGAAAPGVVSADTTSPPATASVGTPAAGDDGDADLTARVRSAWEAVLERVRRESPRVHAIYEPAQVEFVRDGVLRLRYSPRYASFHATNAAKTSYAAKLADAVREHAGLQVRVEAVVEGDTSRRPRPPLVEPEDDGTATPGSAATGEGGAATAAADTAGRRDAPVTPPSGGRRPAVAAPDPAASDAGPTEPTGGSGVDPVEDAAAREAELGGEADDDDLDPAEALARAEELVTRELDARPADER